MHFARCNDLSRSTADAELLEPSPMHVLVLRTSDTHYMQHALKVAVGGSARGEDPHAAEVVDEVIVGCVRAVACHTGASSNES